MFSYMILATTLTLALAYMICPGFGLVIFEKTCPGFGLSFGFHGVHPYQKNICSHPPPLALAITMILNPPILYDGILGGPGELKAG